MYFVITVIGRGARLKGVASCQKNPALPSNLIVSKETLEFQQRMLIFQKCLLFGYCAFYHHTLLKYKNGKLKHAISLYFPVNHEFYSLFQTPCPLHTGHPLFFHKPLAYFCSPNKYTLRFNSDLHDISIYRYFQQLKKKPTKLFVIQPYLFSFLSSM